jgi:hypothetical protein
MSFIYLASPYSHPDAEVRAARYLEAQNALVWLLGQRHWAYSPIIHCHPLAIGHGLPTDAAFWEDYNFAMLAAAKELMILVIPGWAESVGVNAECDFAHTHSIPVKWLECNPYCIEWLP